MTTATQWLFEKLWDTPKDKFEWHALLKEADKKFHHAIMEAYESAEKNCGKDSFHGDLYYDEKFVKIHADKRNKTD
jgi:hypothetical protein